MANHHVEDESSFPGAAKGTHHDHNARNPEVEVYSSHSDNEAHASVEDPESIRLRRVHPPTRESQKQKVTIK